MNIELNLSSQKRYGFLIVGRCDTQVRLIYPAIFST